MNKRQDRVLRLRQDLHEEVISSHSKTQSEVDTPRDQLLAGERRNVLAKKERADCAMDLQFGDRAGLREGVVPGEIH